MLLAVSSQCLWFRLLCLRDCLVSQTASLDMHFSEMFSFYVLIYVCLSTDTYCPESCSCVLTDLDSPLLLPSYGFPHVYVFITCSNLPYTIAVTSRGLMKPFSEF